MQRLIASALFALLALFATIPVYGQSVSPVVLPNGCGTGSAPSSLAYLTVDPTLKLCVNATVSASVSGFSPGGTFANLTAAATSGSIALPAGAVVAFQNTGTTTVSCTLGIGSATALANEIQVPASSTVFVTVGSNTWGACIDQSGSTSNLVVLAGGSGLGTGFGGGGSGGGGGGGAVYGPTPVGSAAANPPVLTGGTVDGTGTGNVSVWKIVSGVGYLNMTQWAGTALGAPSAWGSAPSGNVPGFNANVLASVLPTGAATSANQTTEIGSLATIATNSALPLPAQSTHTVDIGAVDILHTLDASAPINVSTATTTQLVALSGSTSIYVTSFDVMAGGTGNVTFEYGTGSNCGTGTTVLTGAYPLTAQAGIAKGAGIGTVLKIPSGNALCVLTSAAVQYSGSISYQQF